MGIVVVGRRVVRVRGCGRDVVDGDVRRKGGGDADADGADGE